MALIHFTRTAEAVVNILTHGLAYVALPTKVADFVLPAIPPGDRQPQQFGMICFRHEYEGERSERHRAAYGPFGIVVDQEWARSAGAHPVHYVDRDGDVGRAIKRLLEAAAGDISAEEARYPDDAFRTLAYRSRSVAGAIGAEAWSDLLQVFQFLAPASDEWEREWRIVNPLPLSSISFTAREAVAQVSPPQGWAIHLNVLKIPRPALVGLIVPSGTTAALRARIPEQWRDIPFHEETAEPVGMRRRERNALRECDADLCSALRTLPPNKRRAESIAGTELDA